jgi:hypothetical protein
MVALRPHGIGLVCCALLPSAAAAQTRNGCVLDTIPGVVWHGRESRIPLARLAPYLAPVFWFSPDEPSLNGTEGKEIRVPEPFPADAPANAPVVYWQFNLVLSRPGEDTLPVDRSNPSNPVLDLDRTVAFELSFFAYFRDELGLGAHPHDIEPVEFRAVVLRGGDVEKYGVKGCDPRERVVYVTRTTGKAHGLIWFWNVLDTDRFTRFPMHVLVEEGKHALATDKNGDGVFTRGYDVNVRVNDAWGVRDVISTGALFTGGYEQWMSKTRRPEFRVLPPLPEDSPLRPNLLKTTRRASLATYELRPYPGMAIAGDDHALQHIMAGHVVKDPPEVVAANSSKAVGKFVTDGAALKSLSIAYRYDGDPGFSFVFPFFIIKHLENPLTGGYIVQRMYFKDERLRDFGWMAMYTPSASRWLDTYLAAGVEWDQEPDTTGAMHKDANFVLETGLKFRVNVLHSPAKFLGALTPYWGLRAGIKNTGAFDINKFTYVLEFGAGSF